MKDCSQVSVSHSIDMKCLRMVKCGHTTGLDSEDLDSK